MAKFIDKILDSMKLTDDADYPEDDYMFEPEPEDDYDAPADRMDDIPTAAPVPPAESEAPSNFSRRKQRTSNPVVPMRSGRGNMEVCMIKPVSVDDARDICDTILSGRAVVINLEGIHVETAQRIIDFTSGACYSLGGNLQKISNYIFIVTPKAIELSGDFQDIPEEDNMSLNPFGNDF